MEMYKPRFMIDDSWDLNFRKRDNLTTSQQDVNMHDLDYLGQKCSRRFRFDIKC